MKNFKYNSAINYSGYRLGQSPLTRTYPSKKEILEDLLLLEGEFYYLRMYDCTEHLHSTLELIEEHQLNFQVMIGLSMHAEENHINHPFFYIHKEDVLKDNVAKNDVLITEIIEISKKYEKYISSISIGNETRSTWNNNRVSIARLVDTANRLKKNTNKPITFCEEYQTWIEELQPLSEVVDFISLHTYPAWQECKIEDAIDVAIKNFNQVQDMFKDKLCIITETGWPTNSHGSRILIEDATIENQKIYNEQITKWGKENNTLVYLFEAFDEPWKGGDDPDEPEKNWGIYFENRERK
jgi:exo-beta-1,3-glucanase (GH17 family)